MLDAFVQLQLPRRPWLDDAVVRESFHRLAASHHPDRMGGESADFEGLNQAFEILRSPVARLRHLLDLEGLAQPAAAQAIPTDLMDLFPQIAALRQRVAALQARRQAAANALARSLLAGEVAETRRAAGEITAALDQLFQSGLEEVRRVDASWAQADSANRAALNPILSRLAFLTKWRDQLREALLQLQLS